jgi:hypothetical protein
MKEIKGMFLGMFASILTGLAMVYAHSLYYGKIDLKWSDGILMGWFMCGTYTYVTYKFRKYTSKEN